MEGQYQTDTRPLTTKEDAATLGSLAIFNNSAHFGFIYKKTEKLVTAVYMITNFIKDSEPLKWKIRENALRLMAINSSFNSVSLSERKDMIREYESKAVEIVSLSGIAQHAGLISEMNHRVLAREFSSLISLLEKDESKPANEETVMLHSQFFDIEEPKAPGQTQALRDMQTESPKAASRNVLYAPSAVSANKGQPNASEPTASDKKEYLPLKDAKERTYKSADSKEGRQAIIIKLLSKKSGLNVNDFTESIKGVSVKTIQRELLSMVASGVLKKEGERRWSTYSLK